MTKQFAFTLTAAITLAMQFSLASATDYVWIGVEGTDWSKPTNWKPASGVPRKGDDVVVSGLNQGVTIVLSQDSAVGSLAFRPGSLHACSIEKHSLMLSDGGFVHFAKLPRDVGSGKSASQTIASDLTLSGRVTFRNENRWYLGGERLSIQGRIHGQGTIAIGGGGTIGTVELAGDNKDYQGAIVIESGSLLIRRATALGSSKDPIILQGGAFTIGARISTDRNFLIAGDAAWDSHGPNGNHDGTITVNRDATWTIKNGGGNTMTVRGVIRGEGDLAITAHGTTFGGAKANTLSGTVAIGGSRGATILARAAGVNVIAGPLVMRDKGTLRWDADDQIADESPITFAGKLPTLALNGHRETVGSLDLQSDGRIDLGQPAGRLSLADSSDKPWDTEKVLLVTGGGEEQGAITFGKSAKGLSRAQLSQIGFVNPAGYAPGTYTARLTTAGDLVPSGELVQPIDLRIDLSNAARTRRTALYEVPGMLRLCGAKTPLTKGMTISVFGDSITWGGGYINQVRNALRMGEGSKSLGAKVINHGVNGGGVLSIRDGEDSQNHFGKSKPQPFAKTITADQADVAVVYIGVNDLWWRKTTPEVFERALREIVEQAKANKTIPVLTTLAVMKEAVGRRNPKCDAFADITRKVARDTGATLVDLRAAFMGCLENESIVIRPGGSWTSDGNLLTHDGVHMNGRGNEMVANLIANGIYESLRKK